MMADEEEDVGTLAAEGTLGGGLGGALLCLVSGLFDLEGLFNSCFESKEAIMSSKLFALLSDSFLLNDGKKAACGIGLVNNGD